ncbi:hypothetical protein T484DRAFT_2568525 [Baffinella frigidus]|nr:hypothetical protein T484DRAFT_2568525 [Cryptophyta sp. CCMP2293]
MLIMATPASKNTCNGLCQGCITFPLVCTKAAAISVSGEGSQTTSPYTNTMAKVPSHWSCGPAQIARRGSSRSIPSSQRSFDSLNLTSDEMGEHNHAASFPSPFKQLTPLAMLRLQKSAEQKKRVVEARACMRQRLRDCSTAADMEPSRTSSAESRRSSCRSLDLSGISEEYADAAREYALLSQGDGDFEQLPDVPQDSPPAHKPRPGAVRHVGFGERFIASTIPDFASLERSMSLLCTRALTL